MEKIVRVLGQSALESKNWTKENGETVVLKSVQVKITDGVDTLLVEFSDKKAEAVNNKPLKLDVLYGFQIKCECRKSKEGDKEFNSIKVVNYAEIG